MGIGVEKIRIVKEPQANRGRIPSATLGFQPVPTEPLLAMAEANIGTMLVKLFLDELIRCGVLPPRELRRGDSCKPPKKGVSRAKNVLACLPSK